MKNLITLLNEPFGLHHLQEAHRPLNLGTIPFELKSRPRLLHFMVKRAGDESIVVPESLDPELLYFVQRCFSLSTTLGLPLTDRHAYLTVDTKTIEAGNPQRTPGWHLDGMQGDEVETKQEACYNFLWSNSLGTQWVEQGYEIDGLDSSLHNVFDWLGRQVDQDRIRGMDPFSLYLLSPYTLHQGAISSSDCHDRVFLRLHLSKLPITSRKMTVNPVMDYPFKIHTTSGEIPSHLN